MKPLPTQYHIEVYEGSFINDPVWGAESTTPFLAIAKGDRFNHREVPPDLVPRAF